MALTSKDAESNLRALPGTMQFSLVTGVVTRTLECWKQKSIGVTDWPFWNIIKYANILNTCGVTVKSYKSRNGQHDIGALRNSPY